MGFALGFPLNRPQNGALRETHQPQASPPPPAFGFAAPPLPGRVRRGGCGLVIQIPRVTVSLIAAALYPLLSDSSRKLPEPCWKTLFNLTSKRFQPEAPRTPKQDLVQFTARGSFQLWLFVGLGSKPEARNRLLQTDPKKAGRGVPNGFPTEGCSSDVLCFSSDVL